MLHKPDAQINKRRSKLTVLILVDGVVQVGEVDVDRHQRGEVA